MVRLLTVLLLLCIALTVIVPISLITTDFAVKMAEPLVCTSSETLVRTGTRNIRFACIGEDEVSRDMSWLPLIFLVPMIGTLALAVMLGSAQRRARGETQQPLWSSSFSTGTSTTLSDGRVVTFDTSRQNSGEPMTVRVTTGEGTKVIEINPGDANNPVVVHQSGNAEEVAASMGINLGDFFNSDVFKNLPNAGEQSLKAKLEQLQEAHNAGLITADEFERKKQDILNSF